MTTKRRPDGSKRRTSDRSRAPRLPRPFDAPVAPGYVRTNSGAERGETDSVGAFVTLAFEKLIEGALTMFGKEEGFRSHGNAEVAFRAGADYRVSYLFEIHGVPSSTREFVEWREDLKTAGGNCVESSSAGLPFTFAERSQALAERAEEVVHGQLDAELLHPFALVCYVLVTDADLLIRFRVEQRPPRPFEGNAPNRSDLS